MNNFFTLYQIYYLVYKVRSRGQQTRRMNYSSFEIVCLIPLKLNHTHTLWDNEWLMNNFFTLSQI